MCGGGRGREVWPKKMEKEEKRGKRGKRGIGEENNKGKAFYIFILFFPKLVCREFVKKLLKKLTIPLFRILHSSKKYSKFRLRINFYLDKVSMLCNLDKTY